MAKVAALYVQTNGCYYGLEDVDPWDEARDARKYAGPWPVVAHPPCARWGRYWFGGPSVKVRKKLGDDGGCFAAALQSVRDHGGVIEHPEGSHAWRAHELNLPPRSGGWITADWDGGWTCCVEQGAYGHRARKATWLYYSGAAIPPSLEWGRAPGEFLKIDSGCRSAEERARRKAEGWKDPKKMSGGSKLAELAATPPAFRDLLISMARQCPVHNLVEHQVNQAHTASQ